MKAMLQVVFIRLERFVSRNSLGQSRLNRKDQPVPQGSLDLFTLRLRSCTNDVLVAVPGEFLDVGLAQQSSIGHHSGLVEAETRGDIKETVYLVNAVRHMQVALHIVHGLQLAARVEQTADDNVTEQPVSDGSIANSVVERPEYQFRASHLHLGVVQTAESRSPQY